MIRLAEHPARVPHLPPAARGLRVAHLTDFHRDPLTPDALLREAVRLANDARPDLVVLTGDYVTKRPADIEPCAEILGGLRAPLGVWGILGNHDYRAGADRVRAALSENNVRLLRNAHARLDNGLYLAGLADDIEDRPDPAAALCGLGPDAPLLALVHNPALAERLSAVSCLVLAGHTHGGQIYVPILTARKIRSIHAKHYQAGWYDVGSARLYVNRGIGYTGLPFRFLCPPEVALFTLE